MDAMDVCLDVILAAVESNPVAATRDVMTRCAAGLVTHEHDIGSRVADEPLPSSS